MRLEDNLMKFSELIDKDIAVHCSTKSKSEKFLKVCEQQGITWFTGEKPTSVILWEDFQTNTCYSINHYHHPDGKIDPDPYVWHGGIHGLYEGCNIIDYDDIEEVKALIEEELNEN